MCRADRRDHFFVPLGRLDVRQKKTTITTRSTLSARASMRARTIGIKDF